MMFEQIPIGGMPINLVLLANGEVAFVVVQRFKGIIDQQAGETVAAFDENNFSINGNTYNYSTAYNYRELPDMYEWLVKQNLVF